MKIAFFLSEPFEQDYFSKSGIGTEHEVQYFMHPLSPTSIPDDTSYDAVSIFVDSVVDRTVLDRFPTLRCIATRSTGFDHVDVVAAKERGIVVATVPAYGANTVAEHAFALLLSLSKRVRDGSKQVCDGLGFNPHALRGFDLMGKTLGVIGTGNIGRHVVKIGKGFGMNIVAFDAFPNHEFAAAEGFPYRTLDELIAESDVITIHVPYMPATHHLLNRENLRRVKPGVILINTSRGAIVDTLAIVEGLNSGALGGVGLDVLEEESVLKNEARFVVEGDLTTCDPRVLLANHVLIDHPNVIITPHSAFNTKEALVRILDTTLDNLRSFADGVPKNTVS